MLEGLTVAPSGSMAGYSREEFPHWASEAASYGWTEPDGSCDVRDAALIRDGEGVEAMVRYAGARDLYTVSGSPLHAVSERPNQTEHHAAHERILEALTTPGRFESSNELPVDLLDV